MPVACRLPSAGPRAAGRRRFADPLDRDPLMWDARAPGDRPLAARHDVRPRPNPCRGDHAGDVVCLDGELADDRVGERDGELGRGGPQDRHVGDEQGRAEPASRQPQAVGDVG